MHVLLLKWPTLASSTTVAFSQMLLCSSAVKWSQDLTLLKHEWQLPAQCIPLDYLSHNNFEELGTDRIGREEENATGTKEYPLLQQEPALRSAEIDNKATSFKDCRVTLSFACNATKGRPITGTAVSSDQNKNIHLKYSVGITFYRIQDTCSYIKIMSLSLIYELTYYSVVTCLTTIPSVAMPAAFQEMSSGNTNQTGERKLSQPCSQKTLTKVKSNIYTCLGGQCCLDAFQPKKYK